MEKINSEFKDIHQRTKKHYGKHKENETGIENKQSRN